jgi:predicted pyridoxine 5'-phosphate oxidase superfamily flavin-nucleotide-binding protein
MAVALNQEVLDLLQSEETVKILTTVDERGVPHAVPKGSLTLGDNGTLVMLELLESSRTNRNLVRSIWYDLKVSVLLIGKNNQAFQIKGVPVKTYVSGPVFQKHYAAARERLGDVDPAAVWIIRPDEVINQSWTVRQDEQRATRPTFTHLDRLVNV